MGQAKAQDAIAKTLTPGYLRFKLYDSPNSKLVLLPEKVDLPLVINPESVLDKGRAAAAVGSR